MARVEQSMHSFLLLLRPVHRIRLQGHQSTADVWRGRAGDERVRSWVWFGKSQDVTLGSAHRLHRGHQHTHRCRTTFIHWSLSTSDYIMVANAGPSFSLYKPSTNDTRRREVAKRVPLTSSDSSIIADTRPQNTERRTDCTHSYYNTVPSGHVDSKQSRHTHT